MKKILFILFLFQNHCYCQKGSQHKKEELQFLLYIRDSLIKHAAGDSLSVSGITLNGYHNFTPSLNNFFMNNRLFTDDEKKSIIRKMADTAHVILPDFSGNGISVLYKEKWEDHTVGHFNYPVFSKDFKYCIFAFSKPLKTANPKAVTNETYHCYLFRKTGKSWRPIEHIGEIATED